MADNQVVFAEVDLTVHEALAPPQKDQFGREFVDTRSHVVPAGGSFPLDKLPDYQREAVEQGRVAGAVVMSENEANQRRAELDRVRALVAAQSGSVTETHNATHSDYLVPDTVRQANLAEQGAAEPPSGDAPEPGEPQETGHTGVDGAALGSVVPTVTAPVGGREVPSGEGFGDETPLEQQEEAVQEQGEAKGNEPRTKAGKPKDKSE